MKLLACIVLVGLFGDTSFTQVVVKKESAKTLKGITTKTVPCELSIADAPTLRGFRLRDTLAKLSAKIPKLREIYQQEWTEGIFARYGLTIIEGYKIFPYGETLPSEFAELKGVDFNIHFFDESVSYVGVSYEEYEPENLLEFIKQVAATTSLKEHHWKITDRFHASMTCSDFKATLWTGRAVERSFYQAYPMFTLSDSRAEKEFQRRIQAAKDKEEQDELDRKREAAEKLRLERERKKIFKP